jgi:hypothetical protein
VSLDTEREVEKNGISGCKDPSNSFVDNYIWLNSFVMILAVLSFGLCFKHFINRWSDITSRGDHRVFNQMNLAEKLDFFNMWLIASAIGNLF